MPIFLFVLLGCAVGDIPRACSTPETRHFPFCDTSLSVDERVRNLISLLHDEEKPGLLTARYSPLGNVSRIGLPAYDYGLNAVHGLQTRCSPVNGRCATSFPIASSMASSWKPELAFRMSQIMGVELRSFYLQGVGEAHENGLPAIGLDVWSPNINVLRDPRWGRAQETFGESPFLIAKFGVAYTRGLQEGEDKRYLQGVTTLKHWAAYDLEDVAPNITRLNFDAHVSPYDLSATFTPAFKACITEGGAQSIMCSYNAVNGVPTCVSLFLGAFLDEWKFDGYITSDSGAIEAIVNKGLKGHNFTDSYVEAAKLSLRAQTHINSGEVYLKYLTDFDTETRDLVDNALFRSLRLRFRLGLFDPIEDQPYWKVLPSAVNTQESIAFDKLATRESMVLLRNERQVLPLQKGKHVAVIGPHSKSQGSLLANYVGQVCPGSNLTDFSCVQSPFEAVRQSNKAGVTVYSPGCSISGTSMAGFEAAKKVAAAADVVVAFMGIDQTVERETHDRVSIKLPGVQHQLIEQLLSTGKPVVMVLINGGVLGIEDLVHRVDGIVEAFYPGFYGAEAIADVLFGDFNPGGKLPVTMYKSDIVNQLDMADMSMTKAPGRTYRYFSGEPVFPFGYGLSYTTFKLSWARSGDEYSVRVENTGSRTGDEVVQAYWEPRSVPTIEPALRKELFGFERVSLRPGESKVVKFSLDLAHPDRFTGEVRVHPGHYEIKITNGVSETLKKDRFIA